MAPNILPILLLGGVALLCGCPHPSNGGAGAPLSVKGKATTVYVAFGSDSQVTADDWSFCTGTGLECSFALDGERALPIGSSYLNATFSFGQAMGCGTTKAEVNVQNPNWYDTLDISLVDGYSNKLKVTIEEDGQPNPITLGPVVGASGNEAVNGVFPLGCDVCVQRKNPPCGMVAGPLHGDGCKTAGTQYDPTPPCQYQGLTKRGGNSKILLELVD